MEVGEGKNDSLLEILRGHEYVYGGEKLSIDSTFPLWIRWRFLSMKT